MDEFNIAIGAAPEQAANEFYRSIGVRASHYQWASISELEQYISLKQKEFVCLMKNTQSPIEQMLGTALLGLWLGPCSIYLSVDGHTNGEVELIPQAKLGDYRVDFLLKFNGMDSKEKLIVIECDGHEFHEKTKEQAQRDKKRDRQLATFGCIVLRFTGSEIFRNPSRCADEVERLMSPILWAGED